MNKTVNINLAGIFFHIDEDAYLKLQRYLEAIKRSFTDSQGRSEIISDIEARIAELFGERIKHDKQVIGIKEVDEVIAIMGQPEDYLVDDEIFEDEPKYTSSSQSRSSKKLFRDTNNSYIGGVSSGLGHYLGIEAVWMRLIWVLLAFGSGGTFIFIYILFWILVPEAKTTAEKLTMTGEPVNISNIEKKIKDGFETVSDTVSDVAKNVGKSVSGAAKNVSDAAKKQGNGIKSSSKTFFDTLADIILFFLKIFAKFIGVILILMGAFALIALVISIFSIGVLDHIHIPGIDLIDMANAGNTPLWLITLLVFFAIGIPFFFLFYLGLKILVNNLKSIGNIAKFTLLGIWLLSIVGLITLGIKQASEHAFNERTIEKEELNITALDTLKIKMEGNDLYDQQHHSIKIAHNENNEKTMYSSDVNIYVKSTTDSVATIRIAKSADGSDYEKAIERAKNIQYNYVLQGKTLLLDSYLTTNPENKFSDQQVDITLFIPEGTVINFNNNAKYHLNYRVHNGTIVASKHTGHYLKILEDKIECLDCEDGFDVDVDIHDEDSGLKIDENGVNIKAEDVNIEINKEGIKGEAEDVKVDVNADGISVKSKDE